MTTDHKTLLDEFITRYKLDYVDILILEMALTHRSYVFETDAELLKDNERLEFLGDAVINTVAAEYLYLHFTELAEGELSKLRARLVSRAVLARRAKELQIGNLLLLGKGEEQTGGRQRSSVIGAALEAIVGALYLSGGMEKTREFIMHHIVEPAVSILQQGDFFDYKSRLQEIVQKRFQCIPEYHVVHEEGPEHNKTFTLEVWIQGQRYGKGIGNRKKVAENIAAKHAYEKISSMTDFPETI